MIKLGTGEGLGMRVALCVSGRVRTCAIRSNETVVSRLVQTGQSFIFLKQASTLNALLGPIPLVGCIRAHAEGVGLSVPDSLD